MKSDNKYISKNHTKFLIRYHLIFSTKYRRKCLEHIKSDLFLSMKSAETDDFKIEVQETDCDHIHLLCSASPNIAPRQIVSRLKQFSTSQMWKMHKDYLSRFYWKNKRVLWTHGYFCSSIGEVSEQTIRHYIENQG